MDMDMDIDVYHRPNLELACNVGSHLYSTVLYCTLLYKKRRMKEGKMRKFAYTHRTENNQTDGSKTETTLSSVDTRRSWPIETVNTEAPLIAVPVERSVERTKMF